MLTIRSLARRPRTFSPDDRGRLVGSETGHVERSRKCRESGLDVVLEMLRSR